MTDQHVRIAHHAVARGSGRLVTIGLGSCVAIAMHDARFRVAGLAHVLLPDPSVARDGSNPARFAETAVPLLLAEMQAMGARGPITAKLAGGAALFGAMLGTTGGQMGTRNVVAARAALVAAGIPLLAEDVGGSAGRSVTLDVNSGTLTVRSVRGGEHVL
ncbi:MAG: chemotaxis protein CheD [Gemmatimonadota bacterium]|nr:chemotaxis protein CheD [Gemmatimonadota bacterium]